MLRPDISFFLAHFTSDRTPNRTDKTNPTIKYQALSAKEKLISILKEKMIKESLIPHLGNTKGVCFTECPWTSLFFHSKRYSSYGVGFNKSLIFASGGGPAFYVRDELWNSQKWDKRVKPFTTPFKPIYIPKRKREEDFQPLDYTHEREWRIPHTFTFEYDKVEFIILNSIDDIQDIPDDIYKSIGSNKFLFMDMYKTIEQLWPVHIIEKP